jgi:hypothetical protein
MLESDGRGAWFDAGKARGKRLTPCR